MGAIATGGVRVVNQDVVSALGLVAGDAGPRGRGGAGRARAPRGGLSGVAAAAGRPWRHGDPRGRRARHRLHDARGGGGHPPAGAGADRRRGPRRRALHPRRAGARGGRDRLRRDPGALPGRRPLLRRLRADQRRRGPRPAGARGAAVAEAGGRRRRGRGAAGRRSRSLPAAAAGPGPLRPRLGQQPPQPAQPRRGRACCSERGLATLLIDLLTADEERIDAAHRHLRFDIAPSRAAAGRRPRLAGGAAGHRRPRHGALRRQHRRRGGAGGGGGSAGAVRAVVSRGGRPDLAGPALAAGPRPHAVDRRRRRRPRHRHEPRRDGADDVDGASWRSCPAPPTCSRSRAPSIASPRWRPGGSSVTWRRPKRPDARTA